MTHPGQTSAQLRTEARQASFRGYYAEAAELFALAADRYPDLRGELGARDVAGLRREAKACRIAALQLVSL